MTGPHHLAIEQGEAILWNGRPAHTKRIFFLVPLVLFVVVDVQALAILGLFSVVKTVIVDVWMAALSVLMLFSFQLNSGKRYYVTTNRVVWERTFYRWSKTVETPLDRVVNAHSKLVKGKGYVLFETTTGRPQILFRRLKDDPERVKQIVLHARKDATESGEGRS